MLLLIRPFASESSMSERVQETSLRLAAAHAVKANYKERVMHHFVSEQARGIPMLRPRSLCSRCACS